MVMATKLRFKQNSWQSNVKAGLPGALLCSLAVTMTLAAAPSHGASYQTNPRQYLAQADDDSSTDFTPPKKLFVPAIVTYWSHDALGYHPAVAFAIENSSGNNITGTPIQLQAQFRSLTEGFVTITNWTTVFNAFGAQQQITTETRGKRPFELPIDQSQWPLIEAKILFKMPDDERGQTLLVARIDPVAMSEDDARAQLNYKLGCAIRNKQMRIDAEKANAKQAKQNKAQSAPPANGGTKPDQKPKVEAKQPEKPVEKPKPPEVPLTAVAGTLGPLTPPKKEEEWSLAKANNFPGLGDDFYLFEKNLGLPTQTDMKDQNWVWAAYNKQPNTKIIAGSKGRTGKADVVIAVISQDTVSDSQLPVFAKALSGKFKVEKPGNAEHSVRYTNTGRLELVGLSAQSYKALYFPLKTPDGQQSSVIAVSRLPGGLAELIKDEGHRTDVLDFIMPGLGEDGSNDRAYGSGGRQPQNNSNYDEDDGQVAKTNALPMKSIQRSTESPGGQGRRPK